MRSLTFLPAVPMARFGTNPYNEPLYRVIFSDSRTDLIGGKWPDGACEYREVPRYPDIHGWVLEKWMTPQEYAGTREAYEAAQLDLESGLYTCGPYPNRGEYQMCYVFPHQPGDGMIVQIVTAIKLSRDVHPAHQKQAYADAYAKQESEQDALFSDQWDEAMGPFQKADTVISMAGRNLPRAGFKRASDMPADTWGSAAPLPTHDNFFGTVIDKAKLNALTGEHNGNSHA